MKAMIRFLKSQTHTNKSLNVFGNMSKRQQRNLVIIMLTRRRHLRKKKTSHANVNWYQCSIKMHSFLHLFIKQYVWSYIFHYKLMIYLLFLTLETFFSFIYVNHSLIKLWCVLRLTVIGNLYSGQRMSLIHKKNRFWCLFNFYIN